MVNSWYIWLFKTAKPVELPAGVDALVRKFGDKYDYIACCPRPVSKTVAAALFSEAEELAPNPGKYRWATVKYLFLEGPCADAGFSLQLSDDRCFCPPPAKRGRPSLSA